MPMRTLNDSELFQLFGVLAGWAKPVQGQLMGLNLKTSWNRSPVGDADWTNSQIINVVALYTLEMVMVLVKMGTFVTGFSGR